uniref:MnmG N-terminal domain-containing protein n=1 Tax=Zea mays TaxID=4577 RepID=A0A804QF36_MAIZE
MGQATLVQNNHLIQAHHKRPKSPFLRSQAPLVPCRRSSEHAQPPRLAWSSRSRLAWSSRSRLASPGARAAASPRLELAQPPRLDLVLGLEPGSSHSRLYPRLELALGFLSQPPLLSIRSVVLLELIFCPTQPCNPAVGGPAKSQLVHEVDALGGEIGKITDRCYLQKRVLNSSKGPAVRALRAQPDKREYAIEMKNSVERKSFH